MLITAIAALRFTLLGHGALCVWDETRYLMLADALGALSPEHHASSLATIVERASASSLGRPGVLVFWGISIAAQRWLTPAALSLLDPASLSIAQLFSWFYSICALILFGAAAAVLCKVRYAWALLAILLYGSLSNSTFYVRSLNPFDAALCCFLGAALIAVTGTITIRRGAAAGFLAGLGFVTYPGYFWQFVTVLIVVLRAPAGTERRRLGAAFLAGAAIIPGIIEILSSAAGHPYSSVLKFLIPTVSRGDPAETIIFPLRYLANVEGLAGGALFCAVLILLSARKSNFVRSHPAFILTALSCAGLVLHGAAGSLFGAPVFYGRILHGYLPFLCVSVTAMPDAISSARMQRLFAAALVVFALLHAGFTYRELYAVQYPRDIYFSLTRQDRRWEFARRYHESDGCSPVTRRPTFSAFDFPIPDEREPDRLLVNFCDFYQISEKYIPVKAGLPDAAAKLTDLGSHFINFPAYQYEGYNPRERLLIRERNYHLFSADLGPSEISAEKRRLTK